MCQGLGGDASGHGAVLGGGLPFAGSTHLTLQHSSFNQDQFQPPHASPHAQGSPLGFLLACPPPRPKGALRLGCSPRRGDMALLVIFLVWGIDSRSCSELSGYHCLFPMAGSVCVYEPDEYRFKAKADKPYPPWQAARVCMSRTNTGSRPGQTSLSLISYGIHTRVHTSVRTHCTRSWDAPPPSKVRATAGTSSSGREGRAPLSSPTPPPLV